MCGLLLLRLALRRLAWLLRRAGLSLSLGLNLLLVGGESAHPQLLDVLFGGHSLLRGFGVELLALLFGELLGGHSSLRSLSSELLLHGSDLLGRWLAGCRHCERGWGGSLELDRVQTKKGDGHKEGGRSSKVKYGVK